MSEYAIGVFAICVISGVLGLFSYRSGERGERLALAIITLYVIASPLVKAAANFDPEGIGDYLEPGDVRVDDGYSQVAMEAFADGLGAAVAEKFSLDRDLVRVNVVGFDFENMCAQSIEVVLSGRAAMADYRAIERYINDMDIGECNVEVGIG